MLPAYCQSLCKSIIKQFDIPKKKDDEHLDEAMHELQGDDDDELQILLVTRTLRNSRLLKEFLSIKPIRVQKMTKTMMILRDGSTRWSYSHPQSVQDWRKVFTL
jgi:hypothetical protein